LAQTDRIEQTVLKCGVETNPGVPGFCFATKWNQTGTGDDSKLLKMVARDGCPQHSTLLSIPFTDIFLDPRLDLRLVSRA
jgi:hypothetical protein